MDATATESVRRLERDAGQAMKAYFTTGRDQDAINASLWYRQAHHIRIGRPLSKAQYRSLLQTRRRLLEYMSKCKPAKTFLVPLRGSKAFRKLPLHGVKSINGVVWYVFNISTNNKTMLAGFKAGECIEVE